MLAATLISMGVFVSCTARSASPSTELAVRNTMGRLTIKKYRDASARIPGSAPIHPGICGLNTTERPPSTRPDSTDSSSACCDSFSTCF